MGTLSPSVPRSNGRWECRRSVFVATRRRAPSEAEPRPAPAPRDAAPPRRPIDSASRLGTGDATPSSRLRETTRRGRRIPMNLDSAVAARSTRSRSRLRTEAPTAEFRMKSAGEEPVLPLCPPQCPPAAAGAASLSGCGNGANQARMIGGIDASRTKKKKFG